MEYFIWNASPIAFSFGPITIFWYGVLFATSILLGLEFMKWAFRLEGKNETTIEPLFLYTVVGIVVGARLGHCLFYDPSFYLSNPLKIFAVWEGGLASHGGGLGAIIALYFGAKKYKMDFLWLIDRLIVPTALFGFLVRIGNFMNSEIVGVPTDVSWAIIFSKIDNLPRHPAQLYEAFSYLAIFILLFSIYKFSKAKVQPGLLFGIFLTLVFSARFLVEFVKVKQADYDTSFLFMSTGQALSIPFLLTGLGFIIWSLKKS
ncbi:MAG: Phosphatidylglycerol--prolipoprotein diacylglyceryl transferase [uncultured Sulfurimonas sp.]|nr:MAG: Phosphatidylglycerol--prolipoprotein diacylglyceryl transferase [uncultured Sulfurimonas sp.]CAI6166443.1 MAG: Phosphatidylglycerol--prolipoprotein diacylglyceryl transferase [uncultured Sulfurimonas sp.]